MEKKNEIGNRYGILTVIAESGKKYGRFQWKCICDCGSIAIVDGNHLRTGHTISCGCLKNVRHGGAYTPEYTVWCDMHSRCKNKNNIAYKDYGGRGVSVCKSWDDFKNFIEDMGKRPSKKHTLERIDNDAGYCPSNCKWATRKEQQRNRRANRNITHNGETRCLTEWAEISGILTGTLTARLNRGWSVERALTTPAKRKQSYSEITSNGETHSLSEWAAITGVKYHTLKARLRKGWSIERVLSKR